MPRESSVRNWGRLIFDFLAERPQQEWSYAMVQDALRLPPGHLFNNAMGEARRLAKGQDQCIGFCFADENGDLVVAFNPTDAQLAASLERRGAAINGQVINLVDQLEWGARHAADPWLRHFCEISAEAHHGIFRTQTAMTRFSGSLVSKVNGGDPPAQP